MTAVSLLATAQDAFAAGQHNRALELAEAVIADADDLGAGLVARALGTECLLELRRPLEALSWVGDAVREAPAHARADLAVLEARAALAAGATSRAVTAAALLEGEDAATALLRAEVAYAAGEHVQACEQTLAALRAADAAEVVADAWAFASVLAAVVQLDVTGLVDELEAMDDAGAALAGFVDGNVGGIHRLLDGLWQRPGSQTRALAVLTFLGSSLPLPEALAWSARMRAFGRDEDCPLLGSAANDDRPAAERVRAAAAAHRAFADPRAVGLLTVAAAGLRADELAATLDEVMELAPELVEEFVAASAGDGRRCVVLAGCLERLGVGDYGLALLRHALDSGMSPQAFSRTAGLLPAGERDGLAARARRDGDDRLLRTLAL